MAEAGPRLSVIVVNWNAGDHLLACLASVAAAAGDLGTEVVVVDNASEDDSVHRVRRAHPEVAVVEAGANLGFGRGVQLGVGRTAGQLVAVVNPDVVLPPASLAALARFLDRRPRAGVVAPRTLNPEGRSAGGGEPLPGVASALATFPFLGRRRRRLKERRRHQDEAAAAGWVRGACLLFRRRALEDIGGFPTDTFMYGEEILVGHRMQRAGWEVWYQPRVEVHHGKAVSTLRRWSPQQAILQAHLGRARAMRRVLGRPRHVLWCLLSLLGLVLQWVGRPLGASQAGHPVGSLLLVYTSALFEKTPSRDHR